MSLTVFFALCVLGVDFMIYFFFKLLYSEKYRTRPRRLPREYYSKEEKASPLYWSPARKNHSTNYSDIHTFAPASVGVARVGNAGVDLLEGRGTIAVNAGLSKTTTL